MNGKMMDILSASQSKIVSYLEKEDGFKNKFFESKVGQKNRAVLEQVMNNTSEECKKSSEVVKKYFDSVPFNMEDAFEFESIPEWAEFKKLVGKGIDAESGVKVGELICSPASILKSIFSNPLPRFLSGEKKKARRLAKNQIFDIKFDLISGENFLSKSDNFDDYLPHTESIQRKANEFEASSEFFNKKFLPNIAKSARAFIKELDFIRKDSVGQICKISVSTAALISARMHGAEFDPSCGIYFTEQCFQDDFFLLKDKKKDSKPTVPVSLDDVIGHQKFLLDGVSKNWSRYLYSPRLYPLHLLNDIPDKSRRLVEFFDTCREPSNYSFFDYYWVVVPGVRADRFYNPARATHCVEVKYNDSTKVVEEKDATQFSIKLDELMIKTGQVVPVILGERNGATYFIGFWL